MVYQLLENIPDCSPVRFRHENLNLVFLDQVSNRPVDLDLDWDQLRFLPFSAPLTDHDALHKLVGMGRCGLAEYGFTAPFRRSCALVFFMHNHSPVSDFCTMRRSRCQIGRLATTKTELFHTATKRGGGY